MIWEVNGAENAEHTRAEYFLKLLDSVSFVALLSSLYLLSSPLDPPSPLYRLKSAWTHNIRTCIAISECFIVSVIPHSALITSCVFNVDARRYLLRTVKLS